MDRGEKDYTGISLFFVQETGFSSTISCSRENVFESKKVVNLLNDGKKICFLTDFFCHRVFFNNKTRKTRQVLICTLSW